VYALKAIGLWRIGLVLHTQISKAISVWWRRRGEEVTKRYHSMSSMSLVHGVAGSPERSR
jgi:predicted MarR family transcription regulator